MNMAQANIWDPLFSRNSSLLEQIVESAPEGVWVIAMDGRTLYANPAALALLGTTRDHLLSAHAFDFVPIEDRADARARFSRCLEGAQSRFECRLVRPDGSIFWATFSTSLFSDSSGTPVGLLGHMKDITRQRHTEAALSQAEDRLRLAIDAAQLGTFNCDLPLTDGPFYWNDTVRRQHFVSLEEPPSLALFFSRVHPEDRDRITRALENSARHRARYDVEYRVMPPAMFPPQTRWIRAIGRHVYDNQGKALRIDGITLDVTRRKLLENAHAAVALENARLLNEARQANAAKDKFLAVLSHELRTPLNPVLLTASAMSADPALPESLRPQVEMIRRNVELEGRLIDDLLDITRIARGRIDLQPATVDVHTLLQQAVDMLQQEILAKRLTVCLDLSAATHHVYGDAARLQQVWSNLLRNAIKFTPPDGAISVRTRVECPVASAGKPAPSLPDMIAVDVIDSGIGIQPDQIDRVFRPFEQGDESIGRRFGGLGLGLAISHSLMGLHNGSLSATSDGLDRGATFTTRLPLVPQPPAISDPLFPVADAGGNRLQILLVEDHHDTARTMARLLTTLGHCATVAHSKADALRAAAEQRFDLLICDIGLPDGSGLDLLGEISHGQAPAHAVALTGYGMEEDVQRSRAAGFEEHLIKPINFDRIVSLLQKVAADARVHHPYDPPPTYQI